MRIAILYFGEIRYIKETLQNHVDAFFKNNPNDQIDIFAHFWYDDISLENMSYGSIFRGGYFEGDVKQYVIDNLKPKAITFQNQKRVELKKIDDSIIKSTKDQGFNLSGGIVSMFYSMNEVYKLKKSYEENNNIKYDCLVRVRSDIILDSITFRSLDMSQIYGANNSYDIGLVFGSYFVCDWFFMGSPVLMDRLLTIYDRIENLWRDSNNCVPDCIAAYVLVKELKIKKFNCAAQVDFYRNVLSREDGDEVKRELDEFCVKNNIKQDYEKCGAGLGRRIYLNFLKAKLKGGFREF